MSNLNTIVGFLKSKGLSGVAIAGIVGNLMEESGLSPDAANSREGAIGIAQWEGGRRTALENFAANHGGRATDLNMQLGYLWHELTTSYSHVLRDLQHATNVADAARIWDVGHGGTNSGTGFENSAGTTTSDRIAYATSFFSNGTLQNIKGNPSIAASINNGGGGGGNATMSDYQGVDSLGSLLNSVPELRNLVNQAQSHNWTLDKFQNAVEDSAWWKTHSQATRSAIIQRANDPATWNQTLKNTQDSVNALAHQLGFSISAQQAQAIANTALLTGNDSNQQWLTSQLGRREDYSHLTDLGTLQGGMANTAQQLQSLAADYGFNWTPAQVAQHAQDILTGKTTIDTYKQRLQSWAASAFPSLSDQIMKGTTVKQLADPYVQSMSNLLEVDPASLNTYTPMIRKALQGSVPTGAKDGATPQSTPLWQFEQQVRADPRWGMTDNAKSTMSSALLQIGSIFGFGPTG